jgi:hypothetical protein
VNFVGWAKRSVPTKVFNESVVGTAQGRLCPPYADFFPIISLAAIKPPPAIKTAAIATLALGFANPAMIKNAVDSSGVA